MHLSIVHKESVEIKEEPLTCENEINLGSEKAQFICEFCDSEFETEIILNQHISSNHKEKTTFTCDLCDYSFSQKHDLNRHVASVHEEKKPFKCDLCDYSCSRKDSMNRHVESVHEEKKPFKCDMCDYSCFQKSTLKKHVESVHEKKKPFKCDICDQTCTKRSDLKRHVESVHEKKKPSLDLHGKMSHVIDSKTDKRNQKQGESNAKEERDNNLNTCKVVEQNLDDEITIKEEWNVFEQEQDPY